MADAWTDRENSVLVDAYMGLLESLMAGERVVKTQIYRSVSERIGRAPKSVEFKMLNVSGVLVSLGYGFPQGLAPASNFQAALTDVVRQELVRRPEVAAYLSSDQVVHTRTGALSGLQTEGGADETWAASHVAAPAAVAAAPRAAEMVASALAPAPAEPSFSVASLWAFATGGGDVAASPGKPPAALRAPTPAAVDAASDWMRSALTHGSPRRRFLFLVGGPGGGKSHVASSLTARLQATDAHHEGLAHRTYTFRAPGGSLRVINDATIPPTEDLATTIAAELDASDEDFVIACVNRGVLVDESSREPAGTVGGQITTWLRDHAQHDESGANHITPVVQSVGKSRSYVRQAVARDASTAAEIEVLAVFVDVCSLLEQRPKAVVDRGVVSADAYAISVFSPGWDRSQTPTGQLFAGVSESITWVSRGDWDPIAANLQSLSSSVVRNGVMSVLRAAEIASSQLLSYRELWGVVARGIAGPLPETLTESQIDSWYRDHAAEMGDIGAPKFPQLRRLAAVRLHEALFAEDRVGRHPILRATTAVDPARDMVPGSPEREDLGWATPVMEAFAGADLGASPLERLLAAASTQAVRDMVTPFDELLDAAYVTWVNEEADALQRSHATSWYGRYLTRLVALGHGYPAFAGEIQTWTKAHTYAPELPPGLELALTTLVSPRREPDDSQSKSLIPLFASRTEPLRGRTAAPTLSVVVEDVRFETLADGENLLLHLTEGTQPLGAVVLDLELIREALATHGGWTGMTDATESTAPRLERFRSLRLIPKNRGTSHLRIAGPVDDIALSAKEQV